MKSVADILHESRKYMEEHGWVRGEVHDHFTGKVCSYGAVVVSQGWWQHNTVVGGHQQEIEGAMKALADVIGLKPVGSPLPNASLVVHWNDNAAKDQQEVLDKFAKAEKIALMGFDPDA
jgi:hypothetical protein